MKLNLSAFTMAMLVLVNNLLAEKEIKKFKDIETGVNTVTELLETHSKGKANKAKLAIAISKMPLNILTELASGMPLAKELAIKVKAAHRYILAKLMDAGADTKKIDKDKFAKSIGIDPEDAKYADVLTLLYSLNLMGWEDDGGLTLLDGAINFVNTNRESFDMETPFADLEAKPAKKQRESTGGTRSRTSDLATIKLISTTNPCNPAKSRHGHFALITDGMTVADYKKAGGNSFNLNFFSIKGYVEIVAPATA